MIYNLPFPSVHPQKEVNNWYFGKKATLIFNGGNPTVIP